MKVVATGVVLWIGLMSMSSCKKNFTCKCTFADTSKNFQVEIENVFKNDAKVVCNDYSKFVGNCTIQ